MANRAGRIPISGPGRATPNLDTLTTLGFELPMADRRTRLEDAPSDSIRRTSQEGLSPKGWKLSIAARTAAMPEPYQLTSKICLVGERGVGKSSLIRRYVLDQFDDKYVRTLGAKVEKKTMRIEVPERHAQVDINMAIWDIIGHVGFRQLLGDSFFNGAQGILAVADLTRRQTLPVLTGSVEAVESIAGKVPVVLVANKADLVAEAQFGENELADMANTFDCSFFSSRRRHTRFDCDWSSDVCSSD